MIPRYLVSFLETNSKELGKNQWIILRLWNLNLQKKFKKLDKVWLLHNCRIAVAKLVLVKNTIPINLHKMKILYKSTWNLSVRRIRQTSIILTLSLTLAAKKNSEPTASQILHLGSISYLKNSLWKIGANILPSVLNKSVRIVTVDIVRISKKIRKHIYITNHHWSSADQKHQHRPLIRLSWEITNHRSLVKTYLQFSKMQQKFQKEKKQKVLMMVVD